MRTRKADRELLSYLDGNDEFHDLLDGKQKKQWSSFFERLTAHELKGAQREAGGYIRVADAIKVIEGVLGKRAVKPAGKPGRVWWIQLQNRINASGLTAELVKQAAEAAKVEWRGPVKVESVIRQADTLLSGASSTPSLPEAAEDMTEL